MARKGRKASAPTQEQSGRFFVYATIRQRCFVFPYSRSVTRSATSNGTRTMPIDELSRQVRLSRQTIVHWVDRHLIDADLRWALNENNEEVRVIELSEGTLDFLEGFAADYREDTVSRTEARRILRQIDRKKIKKLIRAGDVEDVEVDEETKIVVGSIEDFMIEREQSRMGNGEEPREEKKEE